MKWLDDNLPAVIPLATAATAGLGAAVRALWVALVTNPRAERKLERELEKAECAAEKVILRQERDQAQAKLDEERRDHLTTLRLTKQLSRKLGETPGSSSPPNS